MKIKYLIASFIIFAGQMASAAHITVTADNGPREHFKGLFLAVYNDPNYSHLLFTIPIKPGESTSQDHPHLPPLLASYNLRISGNPTHLPCNGIVDVNDLHVQVTYSHTGAIGCTLAPAGG